MDYKKWYRLFNDYAKQYDLREKWIMYKFHHTYRVVEYAKEIAISLNLSKENMDIVVLSSLLHDIARFKQYTIYKTFTDKISFDHGDEGVEILKENDFIREFIENEEDINIILKAVKNHNKFKVEEMSDRALLITNILRDADKLDIMIDLANSIDDDVYKLDDNIVEAIINGTLPRRTAEENSITRMLTYISFTYDLNFKHSFEILKDKKVLENKFNVLEIYIDDNRIEYMKQAIDKYVKERLTC